VNPIGHFNRREQSDVFGRIPLLSSSVSGGSSHVAPFLLHARRNVIPARFSLTTPALRRIVMAF